MRFVRPQSVKETSQYHTWLAFISTRVDRGDKSDGTLGYALTMLPKSFFITQTLRIREPLGSADVTGAYTEWERRRTTDSRTALSVKRNNNESDDNKTRKAFLVQIRQLLVKNTRPVSLLPRTALCVSALKE